MGAKLVQLNNQRRSVIIEGIVSEFQREMTSSNIYTDIDSEEGAKIFKILETSAEREVLMAEMSPQQLASFASYQSKLEVGSADVLNKATRQLDMEKAIGKALQDAGLGEREVTEKAFAGLISLVHLYLSGPRYGRLIGIDNATSAFTNLTAARVLICTTRKENILSDENSIDHVGVSLSGKVLRELPALASPRGFSTHYAAI
ncbi:hypothetical protein NC653_040657 [Populus alba x Populus x berolinensis]|uniref:Uncharacterized protein n=1 Tax=Populus alba x Populus x berolinensis TaxID=444605 RepID=A0AAD6L703_9ROSI|nr:hypothetical protein NC653_040657 [Populus alba x Populus x berolinensis]